MLAGPMLKLTVRHLLEKKIRFALTTLTVVLGVMFVVGSFVLTDSLRAVFTDLADDIASGVDLTVRIKHEVGGDFDRPTLPDSLVAEVGDVDGVQEAYPSVGAFNVVIVNGEGEPIVPPGPPSLGFNFTDNQLFLTEGSAEPEKPGEFVVDTTTADRQRPASSVKPTRSTARSHRSDSSWSACSISVLPKPTTASVRPWPHSSWPPHSEFLGFGDQTPRHRRVRYSPESPRKR